MTTNVDIKEIIRSCYPSIPQMPFCHALTEGKFNREEILKSEFVELYRAKKTRTPIQEAYKTKLREAKEEGLIDAKDLAIMEEVIDDEGETDDHIDHIDMRYKLFNGTFVDTNTDVVFDQACEEVNRAWTSIVEESPVLYLMAATAAIEDWYAPISAHFEKEYRKRGFSDDELELFIVHKEADIEHSEAQFDILQRNIKNLDVEKVKETVKRTFKTSIGYDTLKKIIAEDSSKKLEDYFVKN